MCLLGCFLHLGTSLTRHKQKYDSGHFSPVGMIGSPLKGIQLLNVTDYSLIEKYGIDAVLESIVHAVKRLEEVCGE